MLKKYPEVTSSNKELIAADSAVIRNILNYSKSLEAKETSKKKKLLIHLN